MAKIRIYELAKEIAEANSLDSKSLNAEIIGILAENGIEVKSASSGIEPDDADLVRKHYGKKAAKAEKKDSKKEESQEKKEVKAASENKKSKEVNEVKEDKKAKELKKDDSEATENTQNKDTAKAEKKPATAADSDISDNKPEAKPATADKEENKTENRNEENARRNPDQHPAQTKHVAAGKLIGKDGKETPYWIAKDGRLVQMNGKALPLKMNSDGKIVRLDGAPLQKRPNPVAPKKPDTENKPAPAATDKSAETVAENTVQAASEEKKETVEQNLGPQPKIVGNIFESMTAAKNKEKERKAALAQQRNDRNGDRKYQGDRNNGERSERPFNRDGQRHDRPNGERSFSDRNNGERSERGFNRDGQNRGFDRTQSGDRKPFGDRNNQSFNKDRRPGMGGPSFSDKDKDDDTRRQFPSKKPSKPSPDGQLKSELGSQIGKNDRAGKLKNKGKDKKDKRDYDEENNSIKKKDPNRKGAFQKPVKVATVVEEDEIKTITIPEMITIKDLADKMKQNAGAIIKKLFLAGKMINQNSEITFEEAEEIALDYEIICEKEVKVNIIEELLKETEEDPDTLIKRPPVVCVMGHVDHGKTSLLDAIRSTNVTSREAGGITQHIGAYMVEINGQKITFLDTPGHEAFTSMRMRGAKSTDIAILVVAADDGVMPQTVEAINHAKAANVTIIVAVNKIDKPAANIERVKQELTEYGLVAEDWGGDTVFVPVSAKTGEGIENLLEMVILSSDVLELKANPDRLARGIVIEAERDRGKGCIATVLVQKGTLNVGDYVAIGATHGRIRAMIDDKGRRVKVATPSTPVEIQGLDEVPNAGEIMMAVSGEKEAKTIADAFIAQSKEQLIAETKARLSLDGLFSQIQAGNVKELNLIIKADVMGSVEAVKQSLVKLSNEEVVVRVIHGGVGNINESDVTLASASNAIIIGFNVKPDNTAKDIAEREGVEIKLYKVIYNAIDDIEMAMKGMLKPVYEERVIAHAEVRQLFKASQVGIIAGSFVLDGKIERGCSARISRDGNQIFDGPLASLKRFKDDVKEVAAGYECGLVFEKFSDLAELDQVEFYKMVEVPRK